MLRAVLSVALVSAASATIMTPMPALASVAGAGQLGLRGGGGLEARGMKRVLSHNDLDTEVHGSMDTKDTRFYAKDVVESEHRSL